ncbi:prestin-like isoform X3 [Mercenaria mercenaria]|uniref:prestin-like isoform X3 n=1 Tax=Mercenaria mercenaria TaxID=6596 RepID=UPI00234E6A95|nr:prestin-like isoform X3 [Mercenaria mercenaria]
MDKSKRKNSVLGRMKRVISSPLFEFNEETSKGVENYHSNRFELGVGERLDQDINQNIIKFRNVSSANLLRKRSLAPKVPESYIGDVRKRFRFYTVLDPNQLSGQAQEEVDKLLEKSEANSQPKILIERSVFSQKHFDESYEAVSHPSPTLKEVVHKKLSKCVCSGSCLKKFLFGMFPFINIMKDYSVKEDLPSDIVSGLTVGIMHIPQGMAYGMLTTLPPVYGLYMSFFPVLVYFFFGSSKHISMGTFAVACLMIGSAVSKGMDTVSIPHSTAGLVTVAGNQTGNQTNLTASAADDTSTMSREEVDLRLQFAMSVTFLVGVIQLLMGVLRLGFITVYLSDPLISGFTTGAACHVFTSQIKHVFGVQTARYSGVFKLVYTYRDFFSNIDTANYVTILLSIVCITILYCTSRFINQNPKLKPRMFMPVPIELIVVVLGTVISYAIKLEENHGVVVVSDIPTGLPEPNLKALRRIPDVISDAIALAIVIFAISISMGKLLAKKHDYEVDANQELVAYGLSTVVSSFFSSAAPSASLSRSLVQERVGGRTQVAGLVSCCLLLVVLLAIGPYFRTLPNCVMASTVIVALDGLFAQVFTVPDLWYNRRPDFFVWIVAFLATVLLDVDLGLGAAVIFNIVTVVVRSQRPYGCVLGQMPGTDLYRDMHIYQEAKEIPGIRIFRFEHSLFFVNTEHFKTLLFKKTANPRKLKIAQRKRMTEKEKLKDKKQDESIIIDRQDSTNEAAQVQLQSKSGEVKVMVVADSKPKCPQEVDFHTIILDCSPWSFVDSMGVKVLAAVICEYKSVGINVILANCKGGIRDMFEKTKFYDTVDHSNIYVSVHDAVLHALHIESPDFTDQVEDFQNGLCKEKRKASKVDFTLAEDSDEENA